jgi:hypothetical protein
MVIKRVRPLSAAKVAGVLYATAGLIGGAILSLVALRSAAFPTKGENFFEMLFGTAAIIAMPIVYGAIGFIGAFVTAALYNLIASGVGGIEIEVE